MKDSCAILIPIYPPHYEYAYTFIEAAAPFFQLYFVFSSQSDFEFFEKKDKVHAIITNFPKNDHIANRKKLFGLSTLINSEYDYIIVIDAETKFLHETFSEERFQDVLRTYFQKKQIFGTTIDMSIQNANATRGILASCASVFPPETHNLLLQETGGFMVYTWWSGLPIYKREHLGDFLQYIDLNRIEWPHFDYILYSFYLIAYHKFHIINLVSFLPRKMLIENFVADSEEQLSTIVTQGLSLTYINFAQYEVYPKLCDMVGTSFLFHLDRLNLRKQTL